MLSDYLIEEASEIIGVKAVGALRNAMERQDPATLDVHVDAAARAIERLPGHLGETTGLGLWDTLTDPSGPAAMAVSDKMREPVRELFAQGVAGLTESALAGPVGFLTTGIRLGVVIGRLATRPESLIDSACARSLLEDTAAQFITAMTRNILTRAVTAPMPEPDLTPAPALWPATVTVPDDTDRPKIVPNVNLPGADRASTAKSPDPPEAGFTSFGTQPPRAVARRHKRLANLDGLRDDDLVTKDEYERIRERILGHATDLGGADDQGG
jgi:hypothetical protein